MILLTSNQFAYTRTPARVICNFCQSSISTEVKLKSNGGECCCILCTLGFSFFSEGCYDAAHYCPVCKKEVGRCYSDHGKRKLEYKRIAREAGINA